MAQLWRYWSICIKLSWQSSDFSEAKKPGPLRRCVVVQQLNLFEQILCIELCLRYVAHNGWAILWTT